MKSAEMTVRRALALIKVFDNLPEGGKDWRDIEPKQIKQAMGDDRFDPRLAVLPELWARYKDGRLAEQILDLVSNIDLDSISKKARTEIERGINRINPS